MGNDLAALIQAAEAKREAELTVQAVLNGLRGDLDRLCAANSGFEERMEQVLSVCLSIEARIAVLVELMAAYVREDADALRRLRKRTTAAAFEEGTVFNIGKMDVDAGRDATVNMAGRDVVGAGRLPEDWQADVLQAAEDQKADAEALGRIQEQLAAVEGALKAKPEPHRDVVQGIVQAIAAISPAAAQVLIAYLTGGKVVS